MNAAPARTTTSIVCKAVFVFLFATTCWAQQGIPPAATPGGAQPRQSPVPLSDANSAPFVVPRVPERPLGLDEGPRVRVTKFELLGAATQPDVPKAEVDSILSAAVGAQPADGYSVNQLQEIANRVADSYRGHGLILAQAVVPAQDVMHGVVNILILDGALSDVRFEGQKMYSARTLARPFKPLLSRPVRKDDMESALLYLTDYPGLSAFGVFQAGDRIGTTDLVVKTQHEERLVLDTTLDNQGSQYSGEYRANVGLTVNNPLGQADKLNIYGLYAFDPSDSDSKGVYGGVDYRLPILGPKNELQVGYSHNLFEVGQLLRELGIKGTTDIEQLGYTRMLSKTRLGDASFQVSLARKDAEFEQQGAITARDILSVGSLGFHWGQIGVRSRGITQVNVTYSHGFDDLFGSLTDYDSQQGVRASRLDAGGNFDKVVGQIQRFQRITQNNALLLRASGQYSDDILVSLEQFSIGGPDTVRAYPSAEFLADSAGFASLEWVVNAPGFASRPAFGGHTWGQILQASLFVDYAAGRLNQALPGEQDHIDLSGYGVALQLSVPNQFFARIDIATPISSADPSNGRDPQYFFRLGFTL
ncbi:MAG TPA: ShlB/FhaC/HecB family hemolysin secretion/activation protein [Steroidobacteraceae bacterium]